MFNYLKQLSLHVHSSKYYHYFVVCLSMKLGHSSVAPHLKRFKRIHHVNSQSHHTEEPTLVAMQSTPFAAPV